MWLFDKLFENVSGMTEDPEFPYLIVVGIVAVHVGFMALIIVYVCRKYKCCACSCFISCCSDDPTANRRETVIDLNSLRNPDTALITSSRIEAMDPSDPGIQHINRFLGRNYFLNANDNESDIGMQHVRRALGLVQPERATNSRRTSAPTTAPPNATRLAYPSSQSLDTISTGLNNTVPQSYNGDTHNSVDQSERIGSVSSERRCEYTANSGEDLSDQLPTYQEAITLLARQESDISDVPPRYEDVINDDLENT